MSTGFHAQESAARLAPSPHHRSLLHASNKNKNKNKDFVHTNLQQLGLVGRNYRKPAAKKSVEFAAPAVFPNSTCSPYH